MTRPPPAPLQQRAQLVEDTFRELARQQAEKHAPTTLATAHLALTAHWHHLTDEVQLRDLGADNRERLRRDALRVAAAALLIAVRYGQEQEPE